MDITNIFNSSSSDVSSLFRLPGQCFYIPIFQRQYSWDDSNAMKLVADISTGITNLIEKKGEITFLGTVITVNDVTNNSIDPNVGGQLPTRVLTVIDGQQRLTTILLLAAAAHDLIAHRKQAKIDSGSDINKWINNQAQNVATGLLDAIEFNMNMGESSFYPRLIRAGEDAWSETNLAKYESPIASLLKSFGEHARAKVKSDFQVTANPNSVSKQFKYLKKLLKLQIFGSAESEDTDGVQFPSNEELLANSQIRDVIFDGNLDQINQERFLSSDEGDITFQGLFRLLVFAKYLLSNVVVTHVVAKGENYAFEMFEALNTTGQGLTAIETFKSKIVQKETMLKFLGSPSDLDMKSVEKYLESQGEGRQKVKSTAELLTAFALAENGRKLSTQVNHQRFFLSSNYQLSDILPSGCREFVHHLRATADIFESTWISAEVGAPGIPGLHLNSEIQMCLAILKDADHKIVIPTITRFYDLWLQGALTAVEMGEAIKSIAAFFALWRGAHGGTAGIDSKYRELMKNGDDHEQVRPFSRKPLKQFDPNWLVDNSSLQRFLRAKLITAEVGSREEWAHKAAGINIYSGSKVATRFLLLASHHDATGDASSPGLIKHGQQGVAKLLSLDVWRDKNSKTIEHVAPQDGKKWDASLYEGALIHTLGNLTLIPLTDNASISNLDWPSKRGCYEVLSASSRQDALAIISGINARNAQPSSSSPNIIIPDAVKDNVEYKNFTAEINKLSGDWDKPFIEKRSQRLAELAWDNLAPWIGYP